MSRQSHFHPGLASPSACRAMRIVAAILGAGCLGLLGMQGCAGSKPVSSPRLAQDSLPSPRDGLLAGPKPPTPSTPGAVTPPEGNTQEAAKATAQGKDTARLVELPPKGERRAAEQPKKPRSSREAVRNTDPLIMENAEKLEGFRSRGEYVLTGNVRFRHGELRFETQRAVWSKELNRVYCEQGMRITHKGSELLADRGRYSKSSNEAEAEGQVHFRDSTGDMRGKGERLTYHRLAHDLVLTGRPELRRLYRDSSGQDSSEANKNATLGKPKDAGKAAARNDTLPVNDTLVLQARRMTYNDSTWVAVAESSVVITRKKTRITCHRAEYRDKADSLFLTGEPKVEVDKSRIQGEKMRLHMNAEEIRSLLVQGAAKANSLDPKTDSTPERQSEVTGDSLLLAFTEKQIDSVQVFHRADGLYFDTDRPRLRNHMRGERMVMRFRKREVRNAQVVGGARSTYFHLEKGRLRGRNAAEGDTIRFAFADGEIDEVLVSGKAQGTYFGKAGKADSTDAPADSLLQKDEAP